jgi:2'-hydroxyisoflavone reductase
MRLLVLGGTAFLGRAVVAEALDRGHEVTTFNRGVTGADPAGVTAIHGDRTDPVDLAQLRGQEWDAVVDTSGYVPREVGRTADLLSDAVGTYAFVSSVSVYPDWPAEPVGAAGRIFDCAPDAGPDDGHYGELKAGCERAVAERFGLRAALLLRPGIILGPHENVGRLPWWLRRIAQGGRVLAPGSPDVPMQLIDARDVAAFTLDLLARGTAGTFDVVGPPGNATVGSWLADCVAVTGSDAELVWVPDDVLAGAEVEPWGELPLWLPQTPDQLHAWDVDAGPALAAGLRSRPVTDTVADTWTWLQADGDAVVRPGIGLDPAKEKAILDAL